jgi:mannosylglycerate hydrolase
MSATPDAPNTNDAQDNASNAPIPPDVQSDVPNDAPPDTSGASLSDWSHLHVIAYLDWQREGAQTFERSRARLLQTLEMLLPALQSHGDNATANLKGLMLAGQTVLLDDIAQIQPDLLSKLAIYHAGGRLSMGAFYIAPAMAFVSGEALIRNLQMSQMTGARHGVRGMTLAYLPEGCHYPAQLPQILRGFGMDVAYLCRGQTLVPLPFRWIAPDGSAILAINDHAHTTPDEAIQAQRQSQPDGPFLWMHDAQQPIDGQRQASLSHFSAYVQQLRNVLPDALRPTLRGSLSPKDTHQQGQYSGRIRIQLRHHDLQTTLLYQAERLLTIAQTHAPSISTYHRNRALWHHSWRLLLHNQNDATLTGVCVDDVARDALYRHRQAWDLMTYLRDEAQNALHQHSADETTKNAETTSDETTHDETYISVWNPHAHALTQVVEVTLDLPAGKHPAQLIAPDGGEQPFGWDVDARVLSLRADGVPMGNVVYTLRLSDDPTPDYYLKRTVAARMIGNVNGETLQINGGQLLWKHTGRSIANVLRFVDGGDAGDIRAYDAPDHDTIVTADMTDTVAVEATPTYERLIMHHRLRIAPELRDGKRPRGLKAIDIMTQATLYDNLPGVHLVVTFDNTARDHRLQAMIRTGLPAQVVQATRPYSQETHPVDDTSTRSSHVTQGVVALEHEEQSMAIVTRGLHEFNIASEDGQVSLALTLLRAIGRKDDATLTPDAQAQGQHRFEFALFEGDADACESYLHWLEQTYQAPLTAQQCKERPRNQSYLALDDERILLSALKPAQNSDTNSDNGAQWVIRLFNPCNEAIETQLRVAGTLKSAHVLTLAEDVREAMAHDAQSVNLRLEAYQLLTLGLRFASTDAPLGEETQDKAGDDTQPHKPDDTQSQRDDDADDTHVSKDYATKPHKPDGMQGSDISDDDIPDDDTQTKDAPA